MPTNSRGSGRSKRKLERHTGADGVVKFDLESSDLDTEALGLDSSITGGKFEIPVTNVDWNRSFDTNDIQHNGSQAPTITTTGVRFDGSFEYTGQNPNLLEALAARNDANNGREHRPIRGTLTIKETDAANNDQVQTITFKRCLLTDTTRDYPSDGSTTVTVDWEAEDMTYA